MTSGQAPMFQTTNEMTSPNAWTLADESMPTFIERIEALLPRSSSQPTTRNVKENESPMEYERRTR